MTAPSRFPWRLAATVLAAAVLLVGAYGTYTYVSAYQTYRGFAPPSDPHGVSAGRTLNVTFYSRALHSMRHYLVYEPPGYDALVRSGKRLPVFYMLHGSPGIPDLYLKVGDVGVALDVLLHEHRVRPMLIVIPDGSNGSIWTDTEWADTPSGNYESFITDVIDDVQPSLRDDPLAPGPRACRLLGGRLRVDQLHLPSPRHGLDRRELVGLLQPDRDRRLRARRPDGAELQQPGTRPAPDRAAAAARTTVGLHLLG